MTQLENEIIDKICSGEIPPLTFDDICKQMEEDREEIENELRELDRLELETLEKSMTYWVR